MPLILNSLTHEQLMFLKTNFFYNIDCSSDYFFRFNTKNKIEILHISELIELYNEKLSKDNNSNVYTKNSPCISEPYFKSTKNNLIKINEEYKDYTLKELLDKFLENKERGVNTKKLYNVACKAIFREKFCCKISEIKLDEIIQSFVENELLKKYSTIRIYYKSVYTWINWMLKADIIDNNPLSSDLFSKIKRTKKIESHRNALSCEDFQNEKQAKISIKKLFKTIYQKKSEKYLKLWLLHMILGTRRNETIQVIQKYKKGMKNVVIKTKTLSEFTIPITFYTKNLIIELQNWINGLTEKSAEQSIYNSIPTNYRKVLCPHGSRAIFRTVFDLIDKKHFSFESKEAYISHVILSSCQQAYIRSLHISDRAEIMKIWSKWLIDIAKDFLNFD
ncbi:MAG: hypothetical protein ACI4V7_11700 [Succinivibrionaceae bacterium]